MFPRFTTSGEAVRLKDAFTGQLEREGNRSAFEDDLRGLEKNLPERLRIARAWLDGYLAQREGGPGDAAYVALAVWGLGASLGFPVGMSAAADDPLKAAARVSVVSTIGYGAFLCGPPLLGLLAEHVGILHSLLAVMVLLVVSFLLSPVARKLG